MTRFTRVKSTHQRVEGDSTSWTELKDTPTKEETQKNRKSLQSQSAAFASKDSSANNGENSKGKKDFKNKNFKRNNVYKKDQSNSNRSNRGGDEESANFTPVGGNPNVKGTGATKTVKIFGNFWVGSEDARRLQDMAKKLKKENVPRKQILLALQGERRKAEKAAKRRRDKTCFNCRQFGHVLFDCPNNKTKTADGEEDSTGNGIGGTSDGDICFKCGSTEHTSRFCKRKNDKFSFAKCFICSQSGHIARQCPKNEKGIYPAGGSCDECGSVFHLKKDCPDAFGNENIETEDKAAQVSRVSDPLLSTEYEEIPEEETPAEADPSVIENPLMYINNKTRKLNKRKAAAAGIQAKMLNIAEQKVDAPSTSESSSKPTPPAKKRRVKF